jgi:hypothetical protein
MPFSDTWTVPTKCPKCGKWHNRHQDASAVCPKCSEEVKPLTTATGAPEDE